MPGSLRGTSPFTAQELRLGQNRCVISAKSRPMSGLGVWTRTDAMACQGFLSRYHSRPRRHPRAMEATSFAFSGPLQGRLSRAASCPNPAGGWASGGQVPASGLCPLHSGAHGARYSLPAALLLCSGNTECPLLPAHAQAGTPSRDTGGQEHLVAGPVHTVSPSLIPHSRRASLSLTRETMHLPDRREGASEPEAGDGGQ